MAQAAARDGEAAAIGNDHDDRMLAALERLDHRIARMESAIARLEGTATQVPAVIATVTDIIDGLIERLAAHGIDVDERLRALLRAADHLTSPRALDALATMLSSEILARQTTDVISRLGKAIVAAEHAAHPVGAWGLLRALRDPEVQRAAGFLIAMTRHFGEQLAAAPQLPPGGEP